MPYDFYISNANMVIEYQGNFHDNTDRLQTDEDYIVRKIHDNLKYEYAVSHGIRFAEIWYYEDIDKKLQEIFDITDPVTTIAT